MIVLGIDPGVSRCGYGAVVAEALSIRPDEVGFVGSGTEAVHRGLLGLGTATGRLGIVHSSVEHSSVLHAVAWRDDAAHAAIGVDAAGRVDVATLEAAARVDGVGAVALQSANQEVGTRQPVDALDLPDAVPVLTYSAESGLQRILSEGNFVATYKYALLQALADLAVLKGDDSGAPLPLAQMLRSGKMTAAPMPCIAGLPPAWSPWSGTSPAGSMPRWWLPWGGAT